MKLNERKRMELVSNHYETWGYISLEKLAIPETVKVTVMGTPFIPTSFNIYGEPNFTEEEAMLYEWKENEIRRQLGKEKFILEADISYEERIFDISRKEFDSIQGIGKSTYDLESFNQMLNNRRLFKKVSDKNLNEFVVFGKYWLNQVGQIWVLNTPVDSSRIVYANYFNSLVGDCRGYAKAYIPNVGEICPCCGKKFTIEDVEHADLSSLKGKICHDACRREYEYQRVINELSKGLMDIVYDNVPFDLLPNGYCNQEWCKHIPWLKFHTPDGDIVIGWVESAISIEWQENFKPFNMAVFNKENVIRWEGDNHNHIYKPIKKGKSRANVKRGIYALGEDKAYEYLNKVKELVNSEETVK